MKDSPTPAETPDPTPEDLQDAVVALAVARRDLVPIVEAQKKAVEAAAAAVLPFQESAKLAKEAVAFAEARVRRLGLALFDATESKTPHPAVTIKVGEVVTFDDRVALDWAKRHAVALVLDRGAFEKAIDAGLVDPVECPYVTDPDPKATIAQDLGKYLPQEKEPTQ